MPVTMKGGDYNGGSSYDKWFVRKVRNRLYDYVADQITDIQMALADLYEVKNNG